MVPCLRAGAGSSRCRPSLPAAAAEDPVVGAGRSPAKVLNFYKKNKNVKKLKFLVLFALILRIVHFGGVQCTLYLNSAV